SRRRVLQALLRCVAKRSRSGSRTRGGSKASRLAEGAGLTANLSGMFTPATENTDMNTKDLIRLGVPPGEPTRRGMEFIARYFLKGLDKTELAQDVEAVVRDPASFVDDELRGEFAKSLVRCGRALREAPAAWRQWGEGLEPEAINQMGRACQLPVAVAGALMPDAHVGYGLPIGGVLATDNAVIPYAVGVDIACRMKLTVLDLPVRELDRQREQLIKAIETETRFGVGASFKQRREHEVLDADWSVSPVTK